VGQHGRHDEPCHAAQKEVTKRFVPKTDANEAEINRNGALLSFYDIQLVELHGGEDLVIDLMEEDAKITSISGTKAVAFSEW
jgi:hypothetical protein